ncbi:hypothetical protein, variant [Aphanomyces invadans]|uniref:Uncharacterized protein n=1 Tax=Aphanomyces invadans TaxID=157072 RepID=A0A024U252_9STRA|nr:hypothetical protein, variant [Aphanomyces invadans]ETW00501.1 hypothetical protein, variant [Aphanomyces invadans]|eukprot:XP_008870636.1 hypothetical protein, variant [Aphanomyces invadans]
MSAAEDESDVASSDSSSADESSDDDGDDDGDNQAQTESDLIKANSVATDVAAIKRLANDMQKIYLRLKYRQQLSQTDRENEKLANPPLSPQPQQEKLPSPPLKQSPRPPPIDIPKVMPPQKTKTDAATDSDDLPLVAPVDMPPPRATLPFEEELSKSIETKQIPQHAKGHIDAECKLQMELKPATTLHLLQYMAEGSPADERLDDVPDTTESLPEFKDDARQSRQPSQARQSPPQFLQAKKGPTNPENNAKPEMRGQADLLTQSRHLRGEKCKKLPSKQERLTPPVAPLPSQWSHDDMDDVSGIPVATDMEKGGFGTNTDSTREINNHEVDHGTENLEDELEFDHHAGDESTMPVDEPTAPASLANANSASPIAQLNAQVPVKTSGSTDEIQTKGGVGAPGTATKMGSTELGILEKPANLVALEPQAGSDRPLPDSASVIPSGDGRQIQLQPSQQQSPANTAAHDVPTTTKGDFPSSVGLQPASSSSIPIQGEIPSIQTINTSTTQDSLVPASTTETQPAATAQSPLPPQPQVQASSPVLEPSVSQVQASLPVSEPSVPHSQQSRQHDSATAATAPSSYVPEATAPSQNDFETIAPTQPPSPFLSPPISVPMAAPTTPLFSPPMSPTFSSPTSPLTSNMHLKHRSSVKEYSTTAPQANAPSPHFFGNDLRVTSPPMSPSHFPTSPAKPPVHHSSLSPTLGAAALPSTRSPTIEYEVNAMHYLLFGPPP